MKQGSQSVRCQIIPILQGHIIVPSVAIAEVVNYGSVLPLPSAPEWLLGMVEWRGHSVPLVSLDALEGVLISKQQLENTHMVILNCDPQVAGVHYIGIVAHGLPHLKLLQSDNTRAVAHGGSRVARCYIEVQQQEQLDAAYILDLPHLEQHYSQLQQS